MGKIDENDLLFIYNYFYNTLEIDLSQCECSVPTFSTISATGVKNPFKERYAETLYLPKGLVQFESLYPFLKRIIFNTMRATYYSKDYDFKIPVCDFISYNGQGTEISLQTRIVNNVIIAEGVETLKNRIAIAEWTEYVCDTITFPSTLKSIPNNVFYHGFDVGGSEMIIPETHNIVCKAKTPPTLLTNIVSTMTSPAFYGSYIKTSRGMGYNTGNFYATLPLFVPEESIELYRNADGWKQFQTILPIEKH